MDFARDFQVKKKHKSQADKQIAAKPCQADETFLSLTGVSAGGFFAAFSPGFFGGVCDMFDGFAIG